jgi:N-acetylmuramic acid 6-phosphate (MurNAc-6-P) etherase
LGEPEMAAQLSPGGFCRRQLDDAHRNGAQTGLLWFGPEASLAQVRGLGSAWGAECVAVPVRMPKTDFLLDGVTRAGVKMVLNALSTCTMVRLGRVMGNYMIWLVPSNLKLIDRATRYIEKLAGLSYEESNRLLFEVIEYIEPQMKADQTYPPVVGMAVLRAREKLTNEQAGERLK